MKFLVNIDLAQNEVQNVVIHKLASAPGTPIEGQVYYDTVLHKLRYRDNSAFQTISIAAGTVTDVTASSPLASSGGTTPNISLTGIVAAANGGTGVASPTIHGIVIAQGASAMVSTVLAAGQILIGTTASDPVAATISGTANRVSVASVSGSITINTDATQWPSAIGGDAGKPLVASGANAASYAVLGVVGGGTGAVTLTGLLRGNGTSPITGSATVALASEVTGTLPVGNGGTGATSLTAHGVVIGNGASAVAVTSAGTAGQVLVSGGASADPAFASSGGDISGVYSGLTVNTVGGASAANIADAVTKRHSQNTDTGTTSNTFQLDSGATGPKLKNESGLLSVRNAADSADADLRVRDITVRNLIVSGSQTIVESNTLSIGDNQINLNEDITTPVDNTDGGVAVTRLAAIVAITGAADNGSGLIRITAAGHGLQTGDYVRIDGVVGTTEANNSPTNPAWLVTRISSSTYDLVGSAFANAWVSGGESKQRIDARLNWSESSMVWQSSIGPDSAPTIYNIARKSTFTIGDGSTLVFDLVHNNNSRDFIASVRQAGSPFAQVVADIVALDANTTRVSFASAPATNAYVVTIIG